MKLTISICLVALLGACSTTNFVGDAPPIRVTEETPSRFDLPARFALARSVYGSLHPAGPEEVAMWRDLAERAESLGSFTPLVFGTSLRPNGGRVYLIEIAREQRYEYLILVRMHPTTGSADVMLYHVGSGGVMATAQAVSPQGGRRGFWGGRIGSPARLERVTLTIAEATVPVIEDLLRGIAQRER